ncbi:MAG: hypothetical protein HFJ27_05805 [Clostridia bacterium]|nr:hypothetical protein [Clostridia bacterium]
MKKLNNILFYIAYFLIIFSDIFDNISALRSFLIFIDVFLIVLLIIEFIRKTYLKKTYSKKNLFFIFSFLIITIVTAMISNNRALIKLPILILAFKGIEFDDFIKKDFYMRSFLIIGIMILSFLGLTDNTVLETRNGFERNSFGVGHPNSFAMHLTVLCIDYFYIECLKKKTNILKPITLAIIFICFIYFFVGSRTNIIFIGLISIGFICRKKVKFNSKCSKRLVLSAFLVFLIISLVMAYLYSSENNIMSKLDEMLSRRLYLSNYFVNNYQITLFGTEIVKDRFFVLDNAYMNLLIRYGIILTIYFAYIYTKAINNLLKENKTVLVMIITMFLIYALSESPIYVPAKNPYIVLLVYAFLNVEKVKLKSEEKEDE